MIAAVVFVVQSLSPTPQTGDSRLSVVTAWQFLHHLNLHLEQYPRVTELTNHYDMVKHAGHILPGCYTEACTCEFVSSLRAEFPDDVAAANDLGYLWADSGKHLDRALAMVQRAADAEPDNSAYRDSLGWALYRLGRTAEALVQLEKAVALEADPAVLEHLGDVYASAGQPAKAKDAWQRAAAAYRKAKLPQAGKAQAVEKKIPKNP